MITTRRRGALAASLIFSLSLACSDDDSSFPDAGAAGDGTVKKKDKSTGDTGKAADKGGGVKDLPNPGPNPTCPGGQKDGAAPLGTVAGKVSTPYPTFTNLTVEWAITGDSDLDGSVRVRYRKKGTAAWRQGMTLRRVPAGSLESFTWGNRHSGSVFDLQPGATYEVELWLRDPDGGCRYRTVSVATRALPVPMPGAKVKAVTPATLKAALSSAQPGQIIDLGAGTYSSFTVTRDGAKGKPIVIRSTKGAKVSGTVDASKRRYVHIVGLTANRIRFDYSKRVSIMKNKVTLSGQYDGIGCWNRAEEAYIADNVVTGTTTWKESALGSSGSNLGECILVTGPGHVITHNRVTGCRDNISFFEGKGNAEDQYSIDVIGNDVYSAGDDGLEADFCQHNCRALRNRFTNVFIAMSSQPGLGGPTYFIRNVVYNNAFNAAFKLNRGSIGDVILHNTVIKNGDALAGTPGKSHQRTYMRNNLFIGGKGGTWNSWYSGSGRIVYLPYAHSNGSYDYDGFGSLAGNFSGKVGSTSFSSFSQLRANTSYKHAVKVDLSIFAKAVSFPANPFPARTPPDLRLKQGAAVDRGLVIPNITDGYRGKAPDLGALELGAASPKYGPR